MQRTLACLVMGAALLGGCKKADPTPGAVKLQLTYNGFRPSCVRVTAWDADAPDKKQSTLAAPAAMSYPLTDDAKNNQLTVAVFRDASWGRNLKLRAEAFERGACEVQDSSVRVLDGKQPVVTAESGTVGTRDGKASDVTLNVSAADVDGDGYVASSDGHAGTDCNDGAVNAYPGAPEVCDGIDNNCDAGHQVDEGFEVGQGCTATGLCNAKMACAADGTARCMGTPATAYYPDQDGDHHGLTSALEYVCPGETPKSGYITTPGDCDDGDPFTYAGAPELCDGRDNDCNTTTPQDSVCPSGGGTFASYSTGINPSNFNWRSVATWGNGGVWMVGENGNWARKSAGSNSFATGSCASSVIWYSLWIDPTPGGLAYYGGDSEKLAIADTSGCVSFTSPANSANFTTRGLMGSVSSGGIQIQGVGQAVTGSDHTFAWNGIGTTSLRSNATDPMRDVHGLSTGPLFAVGEVASSNAQFPVYRFNSNANQWEREAPPASGGIVNLYGVYVVNANLAYAVGDSGTLLRWDGASWAVIPSDSQGPGNTERLRSVLAFGTSSVYVVSENGSNSGNIYRYNGKAWEKLDTPGGVLFDIAGTRPDDLWVVGSGNRVFHWPQ